MKVEINTDGRDDAITDADSMISMYKQGFLDGYRMKRKYVKNMKPQAVWNMIKDDAIKCFENTFNPKSKRKKQ